MPYSRRQLTVTRPLLARTDVRYPLVYLFYRISERRGLQGSRLDPRTVVVTSVTSTPLGWCRSPPGVFPLDRPQAGTASSPASGTAAGIYLSMCIRRATRTVGSAVLISDPECLAPPCGAGTLPLPGPPPPPCSERGGPHACPTQHTPLIRCLFETRTQHRRPALRAVFCDSPMLGLGCGAGFGSSAVAVFDMGQGIWDRG